MIARLGKRGYSWLLYSHNFSRGGSQRNGMNWDELTPAERLLTGLCSLLDSHQWQTYWKTP